MCLIAGHLLSLGTYLGKVSYDDGIAGCIWRDIGYAYNEFTDPTKTNYPKYVNIGDGGVCSNIGE